MNTDEIKDAAIANTAALGFGAAIGALTKHVSKPGHGKGALAMQIGTAVGAAAASGAGLSGSIAAGTAIVTAKLGIVAVLGVAAAPYAIVAGAGYGLYRLFKKR